MDYFLDRLATLNPRLKNTELVTAITSRLATIRKIAGDAADRAPSKSEVEQMRDLAVEINRIMSAPVNQEGQIVKKD
jgi:phosphoribosylaminoimidazole-succinocarboxamide synthase